MNKLILFFSIILVLDAKMIRNDSTNHLVVFDTTSNLIWQDNNDVSFYTKNWNDAINYCENLDRATFTDWRLPNINELYTIVDFTKLSAPVTFEEFLKSSSGSYWTSTTYISEPSKAWSINFANGSSNYDAKTLLKYVRCVRDIN